MPTIVFCLFAVLDQCCWLLYCCWLPSRALLSSLLLSCCTQCYCEALRAQTRWGALEVLFIIIIIYYYICLQNFTHIPGVPSGSPARGGDVTVCVKDINQPSLPTPFILFLYLFLLLWPFLLYFIPYILPTTLRFLTLFFWSYSASLVHSTIYFFMKVSLSPDIILCGCLGLKHQLT